MLNSPLTRVIIWEKMFSCCYPEFVYCNFYLLVLFWKSNEKYIISIYLLDIFLSDICLLVHLILDKTQSGWNCCVDGATACWKNLPKTTQRQRGIQDMNTGRRILKPAMAPLICANLAQTCHESSWPVTLATGVDGVEIPLPVTIHSPDLLGANAQRGIE